MNKEEINNKLKDYREQCKKDKIKNMKNFYSTSEYKHMCICACMNNKKIDKNTFKEVEK